MRKLTYLDVIAATALLGGLCRPALSQGTASQSTSAAQSKTSAPTTTTTPQDAVAAAARKAKEQKKDAPKSAKVFTNENLPADATISTVGTAAASASAATTSSAASEKGEAYWRDKFNKLHNKLSQDQADLSVMQRELGVLSLQNYSDPNVAMQQSYSRSDIDKKNAEIEAKKKAIADDQQAIEEAEADMQKAGGAPGWAR